MAALLGNPLLLTSAPSGDDAYVVKKSLRFDREDQPKLQWTDPPIGNQREFTLSFWIKLGNQEDNLELFGAKDAGGYGTSLQYRPTVGGGGEFYFNYRPSGGQYDLEISESFRDSSAWYHFVIAFDTNESTALDRVKFYINGRRIRNISGSAIPQYTEVHWNGSDTKTIGTHRGNLEYCDCLFADFRHIDGRSLAPEAFGVRDKTGNWNAKAYSVATPNGGTTWSNETWKYVSDNSAVTWDNNGSLANAFKGYIAGSNAYTTSPYNDIYWEPSVDLPLTQTLSLYGDFNYMGNTPVEVHTDSGTAYTTLRSSGWSPASWTGTKYEAILNIPPNSTKLTKLVIPSQGSSMNIQAIVVDGVFLKDGHKDDPGGSFVNRNQKWSSYLTLSTGAWDGGDDPGSAFDGSLNTAAENGTANAVISFEPPGGIAYNSNIEVWGGYGQWRINGGSWSGDGTLHGNSWTTLATGSGTLNKLEIKGTDADGWGKITILKIDDKTLIDNVSDNSFHLRFDSTGTSNEFIGDDSKNVYENCTGGLPIRATKEDYGRAQDGTNVRDDEFAGTTSGTGLVLAVPLNTSGSTTTDVHQLINTGSSNKACTFIDANQLTGGDSQTAEEVFTKFYDKSIQFKGSGDYKVLFADSADFDFGTGDFCIEVWFRTKAAFSSGGSLFSTESSSGAGVVVYFTASNRKIYAGHSTNNNQTWLIQSENEIYQDRDWTHVAVTRASGTWRLFVDGGIVGTASNSTDLDGGKIYIGTDGTNYWGTGDVQDFRIYKGVAKYTSQFQPPKSHDWRVTNLSIGTEEADDWSSNDAKTRPIWETDYTGQTRAANNAVFSDSFADTSNSDSTRLVLAIPGDVGANSKLTDVCDLINTSEDEKTVNTYGTCWPSTDQYKFYGKSCFFDGDSDYLHINDSDFSITDYATVEMWIWCEDFAQTMTIFDQSSGEGNYDNQNGMYWWIDTSAKINVKAEGEWTTQFSTVLEAKRWYHLAMSKDGGAARLHIDGVWIGSRGNLGNQWNSGRIRFGRSNNGNYYFKGYMQDMRFYQGYKNNQYNSYDGTPLAGTISLPLGKDISADSPTNSGTDEGNGNEVSGNYCTLNPLDRGSSVVGNIRQGNLTVNSPTTNWKILRGTMGVSSGKWYYEVYWNGGDETASAGVISADARLQANDIPGNGGWGIEFKNRQLLTPVGTNHVNDYFPSGPAEATAGCWGVAIAMDSGKLWMHYNGTWGDAGSGTGNPSTGANPGVTTLSGTICPAWSAYYDGETSFNFGQRPWKYTCPTGFKAWCTQNLDDSLSGANVNNPSNLFDIQTWKGRGDPDAAIQTQIERGLNFQPDLIWLKNRQDTDGWHQISDAIRGPSKALYSNGNNAEGTNTDKETTPTSDGFTLEDGGGSKDHMYQNHEYVGYCWDAGTSAATPKSGATGQTITASASWVNTDAGIEILTYQGADLGGSNLKLGHNLNAQPEFILFKNRDTTNAWCCYHKDIGNGDHIRLNVSDATNTATILNDTDPTNELITLSDDSNVWDDTASGNNYLAYIWRSIPGFSKFGKYHGSDGKPFVYLGFRPRFVIIKGVTAGRNWMMLDSKRFGFNGDMDALEANTTDAETSQNHNAVDFLSNGFKITNDGYSDYNVNDNLIYAAWAERPFKVGKAR